MGHYRRGSGSNEMKGIGRCVDLAAATNDLVFEDIFVLFLRSSDVGPRVQAQQEVEKVFSAWTKFGNNFNDLCRLSAVVRSDTQKRGAV